MHLTLLKLFEQNIFLSNCSKQLVTPVNLTRKKNSRIIQFPGLGARSPSQKTAFYRGHFSHCELPEGQVQLQECLKGLEVLGRRIRPLRLQKAKVEPEMKTFGMYLNSKWQTQT